MRFSSKVGLTKKRNIADESRTLVEPTQCRTGCAYLRPSTATQGRDSAERYGDECGMFVGTAVRVCALYWGEEPDRTAFEPLEIHDVSIEREVEMTVL